MTFGSKEANYGNQKIFSKVLATSLLATTLISSSAMSTSAVSYDKDGVGAQSETWEYANADARVSGLIRITDLGKKLPYQIGYVVYLSGEDADEASTSQVSYTVYEDNEKSWNRVKSGTISYKSKSRMVSGTEDEYGCDGRAILKLTFEGKTKRLISRCAPNE